MKRAYRSRIITYWRGELRDLEDAYLVVENGKVKDITRERQEHAVDYRDHVILPGFVDTHTHLPQMDVRARWNPELLGWLEKYVFPAEARFSDEDYARDRASKFFSALVKNGTTTAAIFSSPFKEATDIAFEEGAKIGMRFIMGQVLMDMNVPDEIKTTVENAKKDVVELAKKWNGYRERIFYAVTPRFAVSCSIELMRMLGDLARNLGLYVQTHISEQASEIDMIKKMHPEYGNYASVYDHAGLLGERTILAHGVHLSDLELKILKDRNVKISHCPSSNFFLHSGIMSMEKMRRYGISVGFGSDIAAGPYFSMLEVARDASYANKISPEEAFYHITLGGAKSLNLENVTGSLEPRKWADFVVLKAPEEYMETRDLLSHLIYLGRCGNLQAIYISGKPVYER